MGRFLVHGGVKLNGTIEIKGSKNEAYQVICASLLTEEPVVLKNVPNIIDINRLLDLLKILGVRVEQVRKGEFKLQAKNISQESLKNPEFIKYASSIRGTVMLIAPLLVRLGIAKIPKPGGDKIGRRPLDTHLTAFRKLGADIDFNTRKNSYSIEASKLFGADILLDEASVTGTANIIMASVLAEGKTTIYNAASEPYIHQLCLMLIEMGADIKGAGSNLISIKGVKKLRGTSHTIMPDIMEVGTFIGLAAATMSDITIKNVPIKKIEPIIRNFQKLGIEMNISSNQIHIPSQKHYKITKQIDGAIVSISDNIWPGFPPDLICIAIVAAIQAKGTLLVRQRMFESRLFFIDNLIEMGAQIILCDPHRAVVIGLDRESKLRPTTINSPDIRAGLAMMIAALSADGTSIIENIEQIDRGYESIDQRLRNIGAKIERID